MLNAFSGKHIAWLLPGVIRGSGGHRTIIEKIKRLDQEGAINSIYFYDIESSRRDEMSVTMAQHFGYHSPRIHAGNVGNITADIAIATLWDGVRLLTEINAQHKIHFIQDFEAYFNPMGDGFLMAELAYQAEVNQIVLGRWLSNMMTTNYDRKPFTCDFGVDTDRYSMTTPWAKRSKAVAFIYQPEKPRRAWRMGIEALGILKHRNPDVEIFLYGSDHKPNLWFDTTHLGIIKPIELAQLYNSIKAGLCISSSNPSRIPFEMMACGLPLVDLYLANNLYEYADSSLLLAHTSPESIASALEHVLTEPKLGEYLSTRALHFTQGKSETFEHETFMKAVEDIIQNSKTDTALFPVTYKTKAHIAPSMQQNPYINAYCARQTTM